MLLDFEIWLDNHFSPAIAKWRLEELNVPVKSSYTLQLASLSDFEVYSKAKNAGNIIIISKDSDLDKIITLNGAPPKLILVKKGNCDNRVMFEFLKKYLPNALKLLIDFNKDIIEIQ